MRKYRFLRHSHFVIIVLEEAIERFEVAQREKAKGRT